MSAASLLLDRQPASGTSNDAYPAIEPASDSALTLRRVDCERWGKTPPYTFQIDSAFNG